MSFYPEVLSEEQRAILPALGKFATANSFYLGGGTAVALHLGHRRSVDFDWFTGVQIGDPLVLAQRAREAGLAIENTRIARGTLHGLVAGVTMSFLEYPYPTLDGPTRWRDYGVEVASLDDLACMKLAAIAQRGSRKDFIDIHEIALRHRPIEDLLRLYQQKVLDDGHRARGDRPDLLRRCRGRTPAGDAARHAVGADKAGPPGLVEGAGRIGLRI